MPLNPKKLRLAAHLILWVLGFSYHANGAPTKGRLEDPVKVNAKTESVINSALSYLASKQSPTGAWAGETRCPRKLTTRDPECQREIGRAHV